MEQLEFRDKIPLLGLPWGGGKPWLLIDLWEDYDEDLLLRFYNEFMVPHAKGFEEELESLENWKYSLTQEDSDEEDRTLHVLLALSAPAGFYANNSAQNVQLLGGMVYEYYASTNCALITYTLTKCDESNPLHNSKSLERDLLRRALLQLEQNAVERGHIAGANAIFSEVDHLPMSEQTSKPVSSDSQATKLESEEDLKSLTFGRVEFSYFQPPVSAKVPKSKSVILQVLLTDRVLTLEPNEEGYPTETAQPGQIFRYLPAPLVRSFITTTWEIECRLLKYDKNKDENYLLMLEKLHSDDPIFVTKL